MVENNWQRILVIFLVLLLIHFLAYYPGGELTRQCFISGLGWLGGSALLGYVLIVIGGMILLIPGAQLVGVIVSVVGFILIGGSVIVVWNWIKENLLITLGIIIGLLVLLRLMKRQPRARIQSSTTHHHYYVNNRGKNG